MQNRFGPGRNRTPLEAKRDLPPALLMVLLDAARLDFGTGTNSSPARLVYVRKSTRTSNWSRSIKFFGAVLDTGPLVVNRKQWDTAVAPVLSDPIWDMSLPINRVKLLTGRVHEILDDLGHALMASFEKAGYGPSTLSTTPGPVPFDLDSLSGGLVWFDADDSSKIILNGSGVSRWENKFSEVWNASQQDISLQPQLVSGGFAGRNVLSFVNGQHLTLPLPITGDFTLFVVGRYAGLGDTKGTWFSATGIVSPFSGIDCRVYQQDFDPLDGSPVISQGTLLSAVSNVERRASTPLSVDDFGILEYTSRIHPQGWMEIAVNGAAQVVFAGDTSNEEWDPHRQYGVEGEDPLASPPLLASIGGRQAGVLNPADATPDNLTGQIAELLLYSRVLSETERGQVRTYLQTKWSL